MDVIVSWSKSESRKAAEFLRKWLPQAVPGVTPWMSEEDIDKGRRWFNELVQQLKSTTICIICLTPENIGSPWLYFEAGAIAAKQEDALVFPLLIDVPAASLRDSPLSQFQCTLSTEQDVWRLIRSINKTLSTPHDERLLRTHFDASWPMLNSRLTEISQVFAESTVVSPGTQRPSLSPLARKLLANAVADEGKIFAFAFQATENPRERADLRAALDELVSAGFAEYSDASDVFDITQVGFVHADEAYKATPINADPAFREITLTPFYQELLLEVASDKSGVLMVAEGNHGRRFCTNGKVLNERTERSEALYEEAIRALTGFGLLEVRGTQSYSLTAEGFRAVDQIKASRIVETASTAPLPPVRPEMDDNDAISLIEEWLEPLRQKLDTVAVRFAHVDEKLNFPDGTTARLIEAAARKFDYNVARRGNDTIKFSKGKSWYPSVVVTNPSRRP